MPILIFYEDTEEVRSYEVFPKADNYPTYTIAHNTISGKWFRCHAMSMNKGNAWFSLNPEDEAEIPKTVRTVVLLMS